MAAALTPKLRAAAQPDGAPALDWQIVSALATVEARADALEALGPEEAEQLEQCAADAEARARELRHPLRTVPDRYDVQTSVNVVTIAVAARFGEARKRREQLEIARRWGRVLRCLWVAGPRLRAQSDEELERTVAREAEALELARVACTGFVATPDGRMVRVDSPEGRALAPNAPPPPGRAEARRRYAHLERVHRRLQRLRRVRTTRERVRVQRIALRLLVRRGRTIRVARPRHVRSPARRIARDDGSGEDPPGPPRLALSFAAPSIDGGRHG